MKDEDIDLKTVRENSQKPEHRQVELTAGDRKYLEKVRKRLKDDKRFGSISKLQVDPEVDEENTYNIIAENLAGVLQLPSGTRLQISPKIDSVYLIKMWSYVNLDDSISHEEVETILSQGDNYFDFLALILHKELQKIFRKGIYKTYKRKKDKKEYLKGKLLVKQQINQTQKNKFNIEYEELSKDNKANQILLEALSITRKTANTDKLRRDLTRDYRQLRKENVTRNKVTKEHLNFETDRKNRYYEKAITVAKHIIQETYYDDIKLENLDGAVNGYEILFNTYDLFESYIRKILDESISEDVVQGKQRFLESDKGGLINAEPDLLIGSNLEKYYSRYKPETVQAVGDVKYKKKPNNSNHYQAMAYGVINEVDAFLIYPSSKEKEVRKYKINNSNKINIEIPFPTSLLDKSDYLDSSKSYLQEQIKEQFL